MALLERIIKLTTNPGAVVLDPFCGCGTTVDAAQKLGRSWVGIDITYISIDLIIKRLQATFGQSVMDQVVVDGIPYDMQSAQRLFEKSPFDFERWAVSMLHAQPNLTSTGLVPCGGDGWEAVEECSGVGGDGGVGGELVALDRDDR